MTDGLRFWKVQSIGNDFVLVHLEDIGPPDEHGGSGSQTVATAKRPNVAVDDALRSLAISTGRHRFGVGSDGLLALERSPGGLSMRMFNPDGSEDFCGNGLRCAAIHARKIGWVGDRFDIDHFGITVPTRIESNETVETVIGSASYLPQAIPANLDPSMDTVVWMGPTESGETLSLVGSALTTGSAHLVLRVDELPDDELFFRVSPTLETDPRFPERISVIWSKAISLDRLSIRIWERGVGETAGCGTGSSAAAVETFRLRGFGGSIAVENPGGVALVSADSWDSPITVEAPAYEVFSGVLAI